MPRNPKHGSGGVQALVHVERRLHVVRAEADEQRHVIARAFEALPAELQTVVGLRYGERCSFAEIAAILDLSEEHVRATYALAMHKLGPVTPRSDGD